MDQLDLFGDSQALAVTRLESQQLNLFGASVYLGKPAKQRSVAPIPGQLIWYQGKTGRIDARFSEDIEFGESPAVYIVFDDGSTDVALEADVTLL